MSNHPQPDSCQPDARRGQGNGHPVQNPSLTAYRAPPSHQPIPTVTWDPRRHIANDLQNWAGQNLAPFLRSRYPIIDRVTGRVHGNHDFDLDINSAIQWSEHIVCLPSLSTHRDERLELTDIFSRMHSTTTPTLWTS